jgi:hypothetical protein
MVMPNEFIDQLVAFRQELVSLRRNAARAMNRAAFIETVATIEYIDKAIAEEMQMDEAANGPYFSTSE